MNNKNKFRKSLRRIWHTSSAAGYLKKRRIRIIDNLIGGQLGESNDHPLRILEIGCNQGKDFIKFYDHKKNWAIYGIDIQDFKINQANFSFIEADAENLDFPNDYFDLVLSFGMLEHVQPIEKLSKIIFEINRVSKSFAIVVPSIDTVFEPHVAQFFWQLRSQHRKRHFKALNYYSDEAWLQFKGFNEAKVSRFYYLPPLIRNLIIYKLPK